jgi:hypothetical protein
MSEPRHIPHAERAQKSVRGGLDSDTIPPEKELELAVENARSAFLNLARQMEVIQRLLPNVTIKFRS